MSSKREAVYLSTGKAGKLLGVTAQTVRNWYWSGFLKGELTPTNRVRVLAAEVDRLIKEGNNANQFDEKHPDHG